MLALALCVGLDLGSGSGSGLEFGVWRLDLDLEIGQLDPDEQTLPNFKLKLEKGKAISWTIFEQQQN